MFLKIKIFWSIMVEINNCLFSWSNLDWLFQIGKREYYDWFFLLKSFFVSALINQLYCHNFSVHSCAKEHFHASHQFLLHVSVYASNVMYIFLSGFHSSSFIDYCPWYSCSVLYFYLPHLSSEIRVRSLLVRCLAERKEEGGWLAYCQISYIAISSMTGS